MRKNIKNKSVAIACIITTCVALMLCSNAIQGSQKTYEVQPEITIPEYRSDTARAIYAYERLMNRFISITERNLLNVEESVDQVSSKLDSINLELTRLSERVARIELALGIEPIKPTKPNLENTQNEKQNKQTETEQ